MTGQLCIREHLVRFLNRHDMQPFLDLGTAAIRTLGDLVCEGADIMVAVDVEMVTF